MFIRSTTTTLCLLSLLTSCMMIGYDNVTDGSEPDTDAMAPSDAGIDATDATQPPLMDAAPDADNPEASMDSSYSDVGDADLEANLDDVPVDECEPGERQCEGDTLMVCSDAGTMELSQNCEELSAVCEVGFCNATELKCDKRPAPSTVKWCEGNHLKSCSGQSSDYTSEDCSVLDDQCHVGTCDDTGKKCTAEVASFGTICSGIGTCNSEGVCICTPSVEGCKGNTKVSCNSSGEIVPELNCEDLTDQCNLGVCDTNSGQCVLEPITSATYWCQDNILYTCDGLGSQQPDEYCELLDDPCNQGLCDSTTNSCIKEPLAADTPCLNDGQCNSLGECTCTPNQSWCYENTLVSCNESGVVESQQDCSELNTECTIGVCNSENLYDISCKTEFVDDNRTCTAGNVSATGFCDTLGRCVLGSTNCGTGSDDPCNISCNSGSDMCLLTCENNNSCSATCQTGMSCDIDCASTGICNVVCEAGSTCNVNCASSSGCNVDCQENATCDVTCAQTEGICYVDCSEQHCNSVNCQGSSACLLFCDPDDSSCLYDSCSDDTDCSDAEHAVYACNTPCPVT